MEEDNIALEQVVVIGYGTVKKSHLSGAVGSVSAKAVSYTHLEPAAPEHTAPEEEIKLLSWWKSILYIIGGLAALIYGGQLSAKRQNGHLNL